MDHIEIHSHVEEGAFHRVKELFVYRPNDPINDEFLEINGWERFDMYDDDYFYHTGSGVMAEYTKRILGIKIIQPNQAPIWKLYMKPD